MVLVGVLGEIDLDEKALYPLHDVIDIAVLLPPTREVGVDHVKRDDGSACRHVARHYVDFERLGIFCLELRELGAEPARQVFVKDMATERLEQADFAAVPFHGLKTAGVPPAYV